MCVSVALFIQNAKHMRLSVLLSLACLEVPYLFHGASHAARFSEKQAIGRKMCALVLSAIFVCKISHRKKNSAIYGN